MAKQQAPKAAASNEGQSQKASKGHIVLSPFRDRDNWDKEYKPGDDVSHFDEERLKMLVKNKMVQAPKTAAKPAENPPAENPPVDNSNGEGEVDANNGEGRDETNGGDNLD